MNANERREAWEAEQLLTQPTPSDRCRVVRRHGKGAAFSRRLLIDAESQGGTGREQRLMRFTIGLRVQPHDTYHFAAGFLDSDKRHRSPIIDVNQSIEVSVAQFLFRTKEAQARILRAHAFREIAK
jgi:hypothetical protein